MLYKKSFMKKADKEEVKPVLIFTYGYPAAGKTTFANRFYNNFLKDKISATLISADMIRYELYGSQDIYGDSELIYKTILYRMIDCALNGQSVIYDATNLRKDYRMDYLTALAEAGALNMFDKKIIVRINTDKETCIKRHLNRERNIPLDKLLPYFDIDEPPTMEEGWDEICDVSFSNYFKSFYIASPFFKEENRNNAIKATEILRKKGHMVYLPLEHKIANAWDYPNHEWGKMVFDNDVNAIDNCDVVIVLSYGRESTAGTNWEAGYAWGIGKPVIVVEMPEVTLMSLMLANGRTATLKGIEELENYDFISMPKLEDREMEQK